MPHNQSSTEQAFRANLSQFRWANSVQDDSQQPQSSNPFARFYNAVGGGYIPLRSSERSNEEEAYFALSRWDRRVSFNTSACESSLSSIHPLSRLIGFGACLLGAAVCFSVAFLTAPLIPIRPAKFALALRSVRQKPSFTVLCVLILSSYSPCSSLGSVLVMFGFVQYEVRVPIPAAYRVYLPPASQFWWVQLPTSNTFCPKNGYLSPPPTSPASPSPFTSPYQ